MRRYGTAFLLMATVTVATATAQEDRQRESDSPDRRATQAEGQRQPGNVEIKYDSEGNVLTIEGSGRVDLDKVGGAIARWWQNWWEEEQRGPRDPRQGAESGVRAFIRHYDENGSGAIGRQELPESMRDDFDYVDRNDDRVLSATELRNFGTEVYDIRTGRTTAQTSGQKQSDDQTWSEWWNSWFTDESANVSSGARRFMERHDRNNTGYLSRSEMPARMKDEFTRIDSDDDGRLSRTEIANHAESLNLKAGRKMADQDQESATFSFSNLWSSDGQKQGISRQFREFYRLLSKLDKDNDGELSDEELGENGRNVIAEWSTRQFQKFDNNDDDQLSRQEAANSVFKNHFEKLDRNGDGTLTKSEVQQALQSQIAAGSEESAVR